MQLNDLFANLSYGPLANLALGNEGAGLVSSAQETRIVTFANKALLALYKRFPIFEKEVIIVTQDGKTLYPLERIYAQTDATEVPHKHIVDSVADPFIEDVLRIQRIYDDFKNDVPINDSGDCFSIFTPSMTTLQIPDAGEGDIYYVIYQAEPVKLVPGDMTQEIPVPPALEDALEAYVAYQVYSPMNGQEHVARAAEYLARYEMLCDEVERRDSVRSSLIDSQDKFCERGWA